MIGTDDRWFDTTPISRVLTRCSQDISAIDEKISNLLMSTVLLSLRVVANAVTTIAVSGWQAIAPAAATIILGLILGHVYMNAQLPVKRLMSNAKSPIIGHVQNALVDLGSIMMTCYFFP